MTVDSLLFAVPAVALLALVVMYLKSSWVNKQSMGNERMAEIAMYIRRGALAFLSAEYRLLAIFVVVAGALCQFRQAHPAPAYTRWRKCGRDQLAAPASRAGPGRQHRRRARLPRGIAWHRRWRTGRADAAGLVETPAS